MKVEREALMKVRIGSLYHLRRRLIIDKVHRFILGGSLIWGGWYSFNGGSAYAANGQAAVAVLNTHLSASSGAASWILLHRYAQVAPTVSQKGNTGIKRHWSLTEIMNGGKSMSLCLSCFFSYRIVLFFLFLFVSC